MDRWDLTFIAGAALVGGGVAWWVHPAAAMIFLGVVLCIFGYRAAPLTRAPGREVG